MQIFEYFLSTSENSNAEKNDSSMENNVKVAGLPNACDISTQTEKFLDLTKGPFNEDIFEEQETMSSHTEV